MMNKMSYPPIVMFVAFVIFLLCQYAIWVTSNLIAHHFQLTGSVYWCVVCVAFLLLNEFVFGSYDFTIGALEDDDDIGDWNDEWKGD